MRVGSWTARLIAGVAAGIVMSLLLYFPDRNDGSGAILGGFAALIAVPIGLAAISTVRALPKRSIAEHARLAVHTFGLGILLGVANLLTNYGMAVFDTAIREQMVTRWADFSA